MVANTRIKYEIKDGVAFVGMGLKTDSSMTTLDEATLAELREVVDDLQSKEKELNGVIFHSVKENVFIAGADINLINTLKTESEASYGAEQGQKLYNEIEDLSVPTVACVHGPCLGGGLELALACKSIIISDDKKTQLGLPEVKLGILPGFGGTYRLPRRVGLPKSLDMILAGKTLKGKRALKSGLVDGLYPKERLLKMAHSHFKKDKKKQSIKESLEHFASDNFLSRKLIFQKARESVLKKTKGFYQAPLKILDVMEAGILKGRSSYLSLEAQAFGELCVGEQSQNLRHLFFLMEGAKKYAGPKGSGDIPKIDRGICLGAGTMGGGIAWLMANSDMSPIMKDIGTEALVIGLKQASRNFMGGVKRKRMTYDDFNRKQRSIQTQLDYRGFERGDLLIEAVVENMDIKKKVFAETEKQVRPDCLLTTNTSSLSVEEMSKALERPERFAGLHFFNPVHLMPLVEIITHDKAKPETIEALYNWVLKVKKTPVVVKDGPGFLVNRILMPYLNEAGFLLEEGVSMKDIDKASLNFGMPMGPFRLLDEIGIDVAVKVSKIIHDGLGDRAKSSDNTNVLVEKGFYGKKTSKGFYLYDENGKVQGENPEVTEYFSKKKLTMDEVDIQLRLFLPMINEASYILDEGICERASDVDLGLIFGIGFPPFRGGLLRYADTEGLDRILKAIDGFQKTVDPHRYEASSYLRNLVDQKKKFYDVAGK